MKDQYQETHETWNKIAQIYEDNFMDIDLYNDTYLAFCSHLNNPKASILELGCGPGNIAKQLLKINPEFNILATDVSSNMLDLAKKNSPSIHIQKMDCRYLNEIQNTFDGIVCGFTIPYLDKQDTQNVIADCYKKLSKGGIIYLSFVEGDYENSGFISGSTGDRTFFYYYSQYFIQNCLKSEGFELIDRSEIDYTKADNTIQKHLVYIAEKLT